MDALNCTQCDDGDDEKKLPGCGNGFCIQDQWLITWNSNEII